MKRNEWAPDTTHRQKQILGELCQRKICRRRTGQARKEGPDVGTGGDSTAEAMMGKTCDEPVAGECDVCPGSSCHTRFLRPKPDAHRMYAQDQVVIHTVRM
jgi:hypothetical protein